MGKAQAALEFLTTYGWMLIILIVVLVVLSFFGLFSRRCMPSCTFPANFVCKSSKLTTDGNLTLSLFQTTGHKINVKGINCTKTIQDETNPTFVPLDITINNNDYELLANGTNIDCLDDFGNNVSGSPGSCYTGKILIYYIENDTSVHHVVIGSFQATYE